MEKKRKLNKRFNNLKKIYKKNIEKIKFFAIVVLCTFGFSYLSLLIVENSNTTMNYEFLDIYDNWGTSSQCGEVRKGTLSCLVGNNYIPVKQYSKIEKGVGKSDFWKK